MDHDPGDPSSARGNLLRSGLKRLFGRLCRGAVCARRPRSARAAGQEEFRDKWLDLAGLRGPLASVRDVADELKSPAPEDEARLWSLIEAAWAPLGPDVRGARQALVIRAPGSQEDTSVVMGALQEFVDALVGRCRSLTSGELTCLDRVVERKLWEIDRAGIHAVAGGSDDGFLYARGFIVAMGREYYDAVADNPEMAVPDAECEEMCYFFAHLHDERFGDYPETGSGISRESGQNLIGWLS
jgi:hypothetical protein